MKMKDLEKALTEAGWDVGWTVNLHLTRPGSPHVLVETFDENGDPYLYTAGTGRDKLVQVGGNIDDGTDCLTTDDVLAAAEKYGQWQSGSTG